MAAIVEDDSFCPNCGNWKPLVEETGFCLACTREQNPDLLVCENCESTFKADGQFRRFCPRCRTSERLEREANAIEVRLAQGYSLSVSVEYVKREQTPICLCCGNRIKGGTRGRHFFCRERRKCKTAARRYKWYREYHLLGKEEAINKVLESLVAHDT